MTTEADSSLTCTTRDASRLLGISVRTAQLWVEEGRLQAWKTPGGHRRILMSSVVRLVNERNRAGLPKNMPFGVLVLRDDPCARAELKAVLESVLPDCVVSTAENGFEGLIRIGEMAPEVLITDLGMKGIDFFPMVHALIGHARNRAMLVVLLVKSEADRAGVRLRLPDEVVLVGTPVDGAELAALVRAFLRNWGRHKEKSSHTLEEAGR
jgi:excisionase family DNA binding protein